MVLAKQKSNARHRRRQSVVFDVVYHFNHLKQSIKITRFVT